jgi:mannose-6-phosphate isomerase
MNMLQHIALLENKIQKYAWGSKTAIPELLGQAPDGDPYAELWMGAHPAAPSEVNMDGRRVSITQLIEADPESILGNRAAKRFENKLPFLFKVLAAGMPLSIQAHPDAIQAKKGFERETAAGVPLTSATRNYKDGNHKPECICAIAPFWALNGFRPISEILTNVERFCPKGLENEISELKSRPAGQALKAFFGGLLKKPEDEACRIVDEAYNQACSGDASQDLVSKWIARLYEAYPKDVGVLAPAFLNLILLKPGEALYLDSGRLHSYLEGIGMEIMANSDNVLRGGLTPKHVDVPELLNVLKFEETIPAILKPEQVTPGIRRYATPAEEFELSEIKVEDCLRFDDRKGTGVEILICLQGKARAYDDSPSGELILSKGMSMIVPDSVKGYCLEGNATFYRATTGKQNREE